MCDQKLVLGREKEDKSLKIKHMPRSYRSLASWLGWKDSDAGGFKTNTLAQLLKRHLEGVQEQSICCVFGGDQPVSSPFGGGESFLFLHLGLPDVHLPLPPPMGEREGANAAAARGLGTALRNQHQKGTCYDLG